LPLNLQNRDRALRFFAIDELLKENKIVGLLKYDRIGFGYPVHALNAPRLFFEFIVQLPEGKQKKTFLFKTAGDPFLSGGSTSMVQKQLQKKGFNVRYEQLFVMPANVIVRYKDQLITQLYNAAVRRTQAMVKDILSETTKLQRNTFFPVSHLLVSTVWRVLVLGSLENTFVSRNHVLSAISVLLSVLQTTS